MMMILELMSCTLMGATMYLVIYYEIPREISMVDGQRILP
jgi:hypothetical protein